MNRLGAPQGGGGSNQTLSINGISLVKSNGGNTSNGGGQSLSQIQLSGANNIVVQLPNGGSSGSNSVSAHQPLTIQRAQPSVINLGSSNMNGQPLTIQRASAQNTPVINLSSSTNGAHPLLIQRAQNNSVIHQTTTNSNGLQNGGSGGHVLINNQQQQIVTVNNGQLSTVGTQQVVQVQQQAPAVRHLMLSNGQTIALNGLGTASTGQQLFKMSNGQTVALSNGKLLVLPTTTSTPTILNGNQGYSNSSQSLTGAQVSQNGINKAREVSVLGQDGSMVINRLAPQTTSHQLAGASPAVTSQQLISSHLPVQPSPIYSNHSSSQITHQQLSTPNNIHLSTPTPASIHLATTTSSVQRQSVLAMSNSNATTVAATSTGAGNNPGDFMYVDVKPKLEAPTQVVTLEAPRPSQIVTSLHQANSNSHIQLSSNPAPGQIIKVNGLNQLGSSSSGQLGSSSSVQLGSSSSVQLGSSSSVQLGSSSSVQLGSSSSGQLGSSSSGQPQAGSSSSAIQSGSSSLQQLQSDIGLGQQQPNQQILKAEVADAQSKDEEPEMDIFINNVVCSFAVRCHLNLKEIALSGSNVEYRRENGMVIMKLRHPYTTVSMWSSGKITCTGANTEDDAKIAARKFSRILQKLDPKYSGIRIKNWRIVNVLGTCNLPFGIKIVPFSQAFREASYEPELHPGVTYKLKHPKATLKIFSTGSITVTAPSVANVQAAVEHIYPKVCEYQKPKDIEELKADSLRGTKRKHYITNAVGEKSKEKKKAKMLAKLNKVSKEESEATV